VVFDRALSMMRVPCGSQLSQLVFHRCLSCLPGEFNHIRPNVLVLIRVILERGYLALSFFYLFL